MTGINSDSKYKCCDEYCAGCYYLGSVSVSKGVTAGCCNYFSKTGMRRGCAPGDGCTQKLEKSKKNMYKKFNGRVAVPKFLTDTNEQREKRLEKRRMAKARRTAFVQSVLKGYQRKAIVEYKQKNGFGNQQIGEMIGVSSSVVSSWCAEESFADWERLSIIGINKPEELEDGRIYR